MEVLLALVHKLAKPVRVLLGLVAVVLLGLGDYWTGSQVSFALFYLLPTCFVTWFVGWRAGIGISLASVVSWQLANALAGESLPHPLVLYWNTGSRLVFFLVVTILLHKLRIALVKTQEMSRTDFLTGAANTRAFYEVVEMEVRRSQRYGHPLTMAYIDVDNFKTVNDQFGHSTGDSLLRTVVATIRKEVREVDVVARLGGDEFAILFPETKSIEDKDKEEPITRIRHSLQQAMDEHRWPVTFSIGVLTCLAPPSTTVDDIIREADRAMYSVKNAGKNAVHYTTWC